MKKIAGYIRMSPELINEPRIRMPQFNFEWQPDGTYRIAEIDPILGPPTPESILLRRRLGGHPVGAYRRAL